ncbi:hypothetical protein AC578_4449 [Pseudocercospora eumusae]|uniref:Uncharacterized protein n=1 Tax=Pseudocercospora eumusae TaxID=321146 RepID=A0A139HEZ9_9PEZI|nr:hypothetical protein AC578_4449 [Pseudocercospora eumusae]
MADNQIYQVHYQAKMAEIEELKNAIAAVQDAIRTLLASEAALEHEENGFLNRLRNKREVLYARYDLSSINAVLIWCHIGAANGTLSEEDAAKIPSWESDQRICQARLAFAIAQRRALMAADLTVQMATPVLEESGQTAENPVVLEDSESSWTLRGDGDSDEQDWETVSESDSMRNDSADAGAGSQAGYDADGESDGDGSEILASSGADDEEDDEEEEEDFEPQRRTCMVYNRRAGEWQRY